MLAILARSGQFLPRCLTFGPTNGPEDFAFATDRGLPSTESRARSASLSCPAAMQMRNQHGGARSSTVEQEADAKNNKRESFVTWKARAFVVMGFALI